MSKLIIFLLMVLSTFVNSQEYWSYNIDFEDPGQLFRLKIDTASNPNNIWQIGEPQKTIFNSAYSPPNVIVTDAINSYPPNDTSLFLITHIANDGFIWSQIVILSGYYKSDSDSLNDYGLIEFSPDNGETWIDILKDTVYNQYLEWDTEKPVLTGSVTEWTYFYVNLAHLGDTFDINIGDTLYYKFSFISDGIEEQMDGLMYDNLHFEDWSEGIKEFGFDLVKSKCFPNPIKKELTISFNNKQNSNFDLYIYDIIGNKIHGSKTNSNIVNLSVSKYNNGTYFYKLVDKKNRKYTIGKFIKE